MRYTNGGRTPARDRKADRYVSPSKRCGFCCGDHTLIECPNIDAAQLAEDLRRQTGVTAVTERLVDEADRILLITVGAAKQLPGLLGKSVSAHLIHNGWRALTVDGEKRLYIRVDE